jgi:hypothetical protein
MSRKKNKRGRRNKPPNAPGPQPIALPPSAPESKTDLYGLIVGVLSGFFFAVVFVPDNAFTLYSAWACIAVVLIFSVFKFSRRSRLVNGVVIVIGLAIIAVLAFYQTERRLRPSFVYIVPGFEIFGPQRVWAFLPRPNGPNPIFNAQITLIDTDMRDEVTRGKEHLNSADIASYTKFVRYPEISKHNLDALSPKVILVVPYNFEDSHFEVAITWRDGGIHEELAVARILDKWNYKISVSDGRTGNVLVHCRDADYPSMEALPVCFPKFTTSPID